MDHRLSPGGGEGGDDPDGPTLTRPMPHVRFAEEIVFAALRPRLIRGPSSWDPADQRTTPTGAFAATFEGSKPRFLPAAVARGEKSRTGGRESPSRLGPGPPGRGAGWWVTVDDHRTQGRTSVWRRLVGAINPRRLATKSSRFRLEGWATMGTAASASADRSPAPTATWSPGLPHNTGQSSRPRVNKPRWEVSLARVSIANVRSPEASFRAGGFGELSAHGRPGCR